MREGIQSEIGHGALGLRAPLQPRSRLLETSTYEKQTFMECRPVVPLGGWTFETGTTWRAPAGFTYLSVVLDVVWVRTSLGRLDRKETLAKCLAASMSYFFDPDAVAAAWLWDDGVSLWDSTPVWDTDPVLYVNLGGPDPNTMNATALLGIFIGNFGVPQPTLHREDVLVDGSFEGEGGKGDPFSDWAESSSGAIPPAADTVDFIDGVRAVIFEHTAVANGDWSELAQDSVDSGVPLKVYWADGWYKTHEANAVGHDLKIAVGDYTDNKWLMSDGRTYSVLGSTTYSVLPPTHGEWLRATFPFVMPPGTGLIGIRFRFENGTGGAATGTAWVDKWRVRRVLRMNDYYPWLPSGGLPQLQVARPDGYFGEWNIGLGSLRLLNHNRALDPVFTRFNWIGQELVIRGGGRFPGQGGNEVLFDDLALQYVALPKRVDLDDREAMIPVSDQRELVKIQLPLDTYGTQAYPGVEARFNGRPIPLIYGLGQNLTPTQYDVTASGLPIYDVGSNARLDHGSPKVRVFTDEQMAAIQYLPKSLLLTSSEWTIVSGNRAFSLVEYPGPIEIEAGVNDMLDVRVDNGIGFNTREVIIPPGLYRLEANGASGAGFGFLPTVESVLDALPDSDFSVNPTADFKTTLSFSGTALELLIDSGVNKHRSAWKTLGFTGKDDLTGSLSYTADTPFYTSAAAGTFVVRLYDVHGQHDDALGTYTSTPDALIERPGDIAYHLLREVLRFDAVQFDLASIAACRLTAEGSAPVDVVIGHVNGNQHAAREQMAKVISRLETGGKLDILLKGTIWTFTPRDDETPGDIVSLEDRDFILDTWKTWLADEDVYYVVRVLYGRDWSTGDWKRVEANPGGTDWVPQNHGRWQDADFETYLRNYSDVLNRLSSFAAIAVGPIRHYAFTVRGKAFEVPPGGKLISNRTHGMTDPAGLNGPIQMRILSKVDNAESHESAIVAMTDIG